jgi:uracil phosphoribosyltransferase
MEDTYKNFHLIEHPLIKRDITLLRDIKTDPHTFRSAVDRISCILAVEVTKNFSLSLLEVETPLEKTEGFKLDREVVLVPVLRAGLGMVKGFLNIIPDIKVGHIGIQRNEKTLEPFTYYFKTPANIKKAKVILVDQMLATGGSASDALKYLKQNNALELSFVCLVASPQGVNKIFVDHPDVPVYAAALDRDLNSKGYILPGLGDAGDRTFGTI